MSIARKAPLSPGSIVLGEPSFQRKLKVAECVVVEEERDEQIQRLSRRFKNEQTDQADDD